MDKIDLKHKYITIVSFLCIIIFVQTIFSEKSDLFHGIGSDGISISHFSINLSEYLKKKEYFSEAGTRLLPMMVTHVFYKIVTLFAPDKISGIMFDDYQVNLSDNIVITCQILNVFYLSISVIIFSYLLFKKNTDFRSFLLCVLLYYTNFMFFKQSFFEPVGFDLFYLFFSTLLLLAIQLDIKWLKYILLFLSVFISSLAIVFTSILLQSSNKSKIKINFSRNLVVLMFILFYLLISYYLLKKPICTETTENKTIYSLSFLSITSTVLYIIIIFNRIIPKKFNFCLTTNIWIFIVFILSIFSFKLVLKLFTTKIGLEICDGLDETAINKIINNIRQVNSRPLGFLSSHFDFFGLIVFFIYILGDSIKRFLEFNNKYIPMIVLFIFCTLTSESRYLTTFLPFVLFILSSEPDLHNKNLNYFTSTAWLLFIFIFNLIWSGAYIKINPLSTNTYYAIISNKIDTNSIFLSPLQKYFKHLGPWTSNESYIWQLSVFFITLFCFLVYFKFYNDYTIKKSNCNT